MIDLAGGYRGPDEPADGEVVRLVLSGQRDSFSILVRRYQEGLFRYALGMVGHPDSAADVVQDSFVKAYTRLEHCRDPDRFGAWVHRIVRNRCLDQIKGMRVRARVELDCDLMVEAPGSDDRLARVELREALFAALDELPAAQREAFLLKHLEDRSYEEMAEIADASVSALKMRVKRAREALQELLAPRL
jgi:RNA polymerase sigma-70 factor, ECF subfamily